ncbi:uncharacterized protein [Periplaneta americana]|uniref:uncharacterized protein n=1 Tax=Periplaneta americana TaxID=6978 RepID=UPI0037E78D47
MYQLTSIEASSSTNVKESHAPGIIKQEAHKKSALFAEDLVCNLRAKIPKFSETKEETVLPEVTGGSDYTQQREATHPECNGNEVTCSESEPDVEQQKLQLLAEIQAMTAFITNKLHEHQMAGKM